jgi:hypothetical protein
MGSLGRVAVVGASAVSTLIVAGCGVDCIRIGPSAVRLSVPAGWELHAFCVDARCLSPSELVPLDSIPADQPAMYLIEVSDEASVYQYRAEVRSVDGSLFVPQGEVATVGNRLGGEKCRPTMFGAGVTVDETGQVTVQQP